MSKTDKFSSDYSGGGYLGYNFKATRFLESGSGGFRKQNRGVLTDDCQKYYGVVRTQNEQHNGKVMEDMCEKAINLYNELMEDGLKVRYRDDGTMDEKEVQSLHESAQQKAMEKFQTIAKIGPEQLWKDYRDRILEKCKMRLDVVNAENEERNKQLIQKAKEKSFIKYKAYVDAIIKVRREIGESVAEHELKRVHEEAMRAAMGTFDAASLIGLNNAPVNNKEQDSRAIEWWN
uniref:uncharacterized protein LOC120331938 n=1 Tax=Styela clava TaxID=7725 RepID=UPI00193AB908|nr:uncharacterized protein LOC120331938 [Styela clava]